MELLIVLFVLMLLLSSPKIKGYLGELSVSRYLGMLNQEEYKIFNDVYLAKKNGRTTQIDHIIVSIYGIFVVETKNYKGWITGGEKSEYWTQIIYKKRKPLYNPIRQNYGHAKAVQEILSSYSNIPIIPIVAFSSRADLKVRVENSHVVYIHNVKDVIMKYNEEKISKEEMNNICTIISDKCIKDKTVKKQHVKEIKKNVQEKEVKKMLNICPRCGGNLIKRNGKYGQFMGCSNYPKCRYTKNERK